MREVAVLFARADSIYKTLPGCDVWDAERDARKWQGGAPGVYHPPCRAWGRLRHFAKPRHDEKDLARWAVRQIRQWGGVLEHPAKSTLWADMGLPEPGQTDACGGFTISAPQYWWGHLAYKPTWFYVCGIERDKIPAIPFKPGEAPMVMQYSHKCRRRPQIPHKLREVTPPALAQWLVDLARLTQPPHTCRKAETRGER